MEHIVNVSKIKDLDELTKWMVSWLPGYTLLPTQDISVKDTVVYSDPASSVAYPVAVYGYNEQGGVVVIIKHQLHAEQLVIEVSDVTWWACEATSESVDFLSIYNELKQTDGEVELGDLLVAYAAVYTREVRIPREDHPRIIAANTPNDFKSK